MKKLFILLLFISTSLFPDKIKVTRAANIRNIYLPSSVSKVVDVAEIGSIFTVQEKYGDWVKVRVIKGKDKKSTSDHVGKVGFMWTYCVDLINGKVINMGVNLRMQPDIDSASIAKVKKGATLEIIWLKVTWYSIGKNKWIWEGLVSET